ncbi:hypothetical protein BH11PSE8_BH11PSE8_34130 [soil metagenome]
MSNDDPKTRTVTKPQARVVPPQTDPDVTVIRPPQHAFPSSSPPSAQHDNGNMLPIGTFLAEFELTEVLGEGGFGIVYLARDHSLQRRVALKEYMPSSLAARVGGTNVSVKSERHRETFEAGLKSFVNEARMLAQFDHPSLVKVYRFWEANGTAYMVMPFYEGVTLKQHLKDMGAPPNEAWLMELLEPLSEALSVIHAEQCYHRDIAPDNVILLKGSNRPLLLDFGAARRVIGDMTQALTVILKPGYAPVEQYAEVPGMKQGGWTDVYALAAVVYFAIQGRTPPTSVARLMNDSYVPLTQAAAGRYSEGFLSAIDHALAVKPEERTQSIDALRESLGMGVLAPDRPAGGRATEMPRAASRPSSAAAAPASTSTSAGPSETTRVKTPMWIGAGVVALVVVGGGLYAVMGPSKPPAVSSVPSTATSATAGPTSASAAAAALPMAVPPVPDQPAAPAVVNGPFDPVREFERVASAQTPGFDVEGKTAKPQARIGKDKLAFSVKSSRDGYLYVFQYGTDNTLIQLFPNELTVDNRLRAGQTMNLPQASWVLGIGGPPGIDHFLAIVSKEPRDFSAANFKVSMGFAQLTAEAAADAASRYSGPVSVFVGKPACAAPCSDEYGAALFSAEEIN